MKRHDEVDFNLFKDSVFTSKAKTDGLTNDGEIIAKWEVKDEDYKLLETARVYYEALRDNRERRRRALKYTRGKQWSDVIEDPQKPGTYITEEDYLRRQGRIPLKQNQIIQMLNNRIGQFRQSQSKTIFIARANEKSLEADVMTNALEYVSYINNLDEKDANSYREFGLCGVICHKIRYKWFESRNMYDVYVEPVNFNRLFFNTNIESPFGEDINFIGEIIDAPLDDVIAAFAKSKIEENIIRKYYEAYIDEATTLANKPGYERYENIDFFFSNDRSLCRLFEIWYKKAEWKTYVHDYADGTYVKTDMTPEEIDFENQKRIELGLNNGLDLENIPLLEYEERYENTWYVKYLTPDGHCLYEGETQYIHEEHPYVIRFSQMIDGEIWGWIEDVIDQQKYINRLIILIDFVMSSSAKGVLMIPKDTIPAGMTPKDFADAWVSYNGVIVYDPKPHGQIPQQISMNSTNFGVHELLALQMQLMQDISGIHPAVQGKEAKSGTPASLYALEAQNANTNILDSILQFKDFKQRRDFKIARVIKQFYKEKRFLAISGNIYNEQSKIYDPEIMQDVDFEAITTTSTNNTVYKSMMDDLLLKLLEMNQIDIEIFLENASLPYAKHILEEIRKKQQQMQDTQAGVEQAGIPQLSEEQYQQILQGANPQAINMAKQMLNPKTQSYA